MDYIFHFYTNALLIFFVSLLVSYVFWEYNSIIEEFRQNQTNLTESSSESSQ